MILMILYFAYLIKSLHEAYNDLIIKNIIIICYCCIILFILSLHCIELFKNLIILLKFIISKFKSYFKTGNYKFSPIYTEVSHYDVYIIREDEDLALGKID